MSASDGDLFNIGADLLPEKELQSYRTRVDFAFIFHPRDVKDIARKFPFVTRLPEQRVMRIFERLHISFLEDEVMLGIKFEANQNVRVEGLFLDLIDQGEQHLMLRVLPDDVAGFLHRIDFEYGNQSR